MSQPILLKKISEGFADDASPQDVANASALATQSSQGVMSAADKIKLDNTDTNSQSYTDAETARAITAENTKLAKSNNLSDVVNAATARANIGLGTAAVLNVPVSGNASSSQVVKGDDTRLSGRTSIYTISVDTILTINDDTILVNTNSIIINVTLPDATTMPGKYYDIKNIGTHDCVVVGNMNTIDGLSSKTISTQYDSFKVQSDGVNWWIL